MDEAGIFERMRGDHRRVLATVAGIEADLLSGGVRALGPRDEERLREACALMESQFTSHMAAEDEILYPSLMQTLPETRASVVPLAGEHLELRDMLARLTATLDEPAGPERDEQIAVQIRDFIDLLRIHIRKEEALVISVAERVLRPREVEFLATRMALGARAGHHAGPVEGQKGVRE
jgi:hemerythrin-like domain-containing protein